MHNVAVTIEPNRFGHYTIWPSKSFIRDYKDSAHDDGETMINGAYLQTGNEREHLKESISKYAWNQLQRGYSVRVRVYGELALCWFNVAW